MINKIKHIIREEIENIMNEHITQEVLWKNDWFSVVKKTDKDGAMMIGLKPTLQNVVVLPFTKINNKINQIGVHYEVNPLWGPGQHSTSITGGIEKKETNLEAAKRELFEESGYLVEEDNKWVDLGSVKSSKLIDLEQPCFGVDITNIKPQKATKDGTINEQNSEFKLIEPKKVLGETKDVYLPTLYFKLLMNQ